MAMKSTAEYGGPSADGDKSTAEYRPEAGFGEGGEGGKSTAEVNSNYDSAAPPAYGAIEMNEDAKSTNEPPSHVGHQYSNTGGGGNAQHGSFYGRPPQPQQPLQSTTYAPQMLVPMSSEAGYGPIGGPPISGAPVPMGAPHQPYGVPPPNQGNFYSGYGPQPPPMQSAAGVQHHPQVYYPPPAVEPGPQPAPQIIVVEKIIEVEKQATPPADPIVYPGFGFGLNTGAPVDPQETKLFIYSLICVIWYCIVLSQKSDGLWHVGGNLENTSYTIDTDYGWQSATYHTSDTYSTNVTPVWLEYIAIDAGRFLKTTCIIGIVLSILQIIAGAYARFQKLTCDSVKGQYIHNLKQWTYWVQKEFYWWTLFWYIMLAAFTAIMAFCYAQDTYCAAYSYCLKGWIMYPNVMLIIHIVVYPFFTVSSYHRYIRLVPRSHQFAVPMFSYWLRSLSQSMVLLILVLQFHRSGLICWVYQSGDVQFALEIGYNYGDNVSFSTKVDDAMDTLNAFICITIGCVAFRSLVTLIAGFQDPTLTNWYKSTIMKGLLALIVAAEVFFLSYGLVNLYLKWHNHYSDELGGWWLPGWGIIPYLYLFFSVLGNLCTLTGCCTNK